MKESTPSPDELNQLISLFNARRFQELESRARLMVEKHPASGFIWKLLGVTLLSQGKDALFAMQQAAQLLPDDAEAQYNLGNVQNALGRIDDAVACYRRAVKINPNDILIYFTLAKVLKNAKRLDEAAAIYRQVLQIKPDVMAAHYNLGNLFYDMNRLDEAEICYQRASDIEPNDAEIHNNLGLVIKKLGRPDEAAACYLRALQINPIYAEAHSNLGLSLHDQGHLVGAEASYRRALQIKPDIAEAHSNLGNTIKELGRFDEAEVCNREALRINPNFAEAHLNLGNTLKEKGKLDEAEACYRRALQLNPYIAEAHLNLGNSLKELGRFDEAETFYRRALEVKPDYAEAQVALAILSILILPNTELESVAVPGNFSRALRNLTDWLASLDSKPKSFHKSISSHTPFYLAYRDGNHVELLSSYGNLVAERKGRDLKMAEHTKKRKLRLAIVSRHIHDQSVWHIIIKGLLTHLDRQTFEIVVYYTGYFEDRETAVAKSLADVWRDVKSVGRYGGWQGAMVTDAPDVILYPELGMDPVALQLAGCRLATLQAASWGHPITSGLPTIDLYFSGELIEPAEADVHYRERLVRLPGTGCCTTPLVVLPAALAEFETELALRSGPRFIISQMPFKFDPSDDALYSRIAERVGDSTFILLRSTQFPWATERVFARLSQAFRERGLIAEDHLKLIPWLSREKFYALLELCDVYLDCPSFSGYTTAWQALHCGIPVVTLEGKYMRQRLAGGLLRKVGIMETIAATRDDYVRISSFLAAQSRDRVSYKIRRQAIKVAASSADNDVRVVRAFEKTLIDAFNVTEA